MTSEVYFSKDIDRIIGKIDSSRIGKNIAIKLHFGERGNETYIRPEIVRKVYEKILSMGKNATLVECNVLYKGSRTTASDHITVAKEHGFGFAPIDILDGERGDQFVEVNIKNGLMNPVKLGKGLKKYDSMVVLTHFKGHSFAGFGGALKNVGMGLGSRAGKLRMHSNVNPKVDESKCIGCGMCVANCESNAITITNNKAHVDPEKCVGCAMCISVCEQRAVNAFGDSTNSDLQKRIVDSVDGVMNIIPRDRIVYITVLESITAMCDCLGIKQTPIMHDVGILLSDDIVAIDKASLDLANENSNGAFDKINSVDKNIQINYATEKGLGEKDYSLIRL